MEDTGERAIGNSRKLYDFERIYKYVRDKYKNKNANVLDYGCGSGYGVLLLSEYFKSVFGIDVSEEAIEYCKNKYKFNKSNINYSTFDPSSQPYPDNYFDYIISFQVFEHIPLELIDNYILNIRNMLKTNGKAVITTPNCINYYNNFSGNNYHVKEYSKQELEELFAKYFDKENILIYACEDVLSTRIRLLIRKKGKNHFISKILSKIITTPIRFLELRQLIKSDHHKMMKFSNVTNTVGSLVVEISKR